MIEAVVFDVDFTLAKPGPDLGPEGYRRLGARFGLELEPGRYDEARRDAIGTLKRHPELDHDEEIWVLFTERIIQGMGGAGDTYACAVEMTRAWERAEHFELYEDALPVLDELRARGLKLGLLSNTGRDLDVFVSHHGIEVDAILTSRIHGKTKPHETIFRAMLEKLAVAPATAVMVGDDPTTTSRARVRSACRRGSSTATAAFRSTRTDSPTCARFPRRSVWCENPARCRVG